MPPVPIGTHAPPGPPACKGGPLLAGGPTWQNALLDPGRDDLLDRNQLPLKVETFGECGGSCSKQTLVITTPCRSTKMRSALSALGPLLAEINRTIDSLARRSLSRAGLFGTLAQAVIVRMKRFVSEETFAGKKIKFPSSVAAGA